MATKSGAYGANDTAVAEPSGAYSASDKPADAPPAGKLRRAADTGLALGRGIVAVPETAVGISDLITGGRTGKAVERLGVRFKDAKQVLTDFQSDEQKAADARVQQADGFLPTVGAMIENPSTIANAVAESAPSMLAGGAVSRGLVNKGVSGITAGAVGEGVVSAGQAAEQVRQEGPTGFLTPKQAALAATSGAATGVINRASGKLADKLGIGDVNTAMATGKLGGTTERGIAQRTAYGAINEGVLQELPQSMQEQALQNLALDKPVGEGVAEAGAAGMLVGGLTGGGFGALTPPSKQNSVQPGAALNEQGGGNGVSNSPVKPPSIGSTEIESSGQSAATVVGGQAAPTKSVLDVGLVRPEGGGNHSKPEAGLAQGDGLGKRPGELASGGLDGGSAGLSQGSSPSLNTQNSIVKPPVDKAAAIGINRNEGPLSAGAAIAVDTGADVVTQQQAVEKQKAEAAAKEKAKPGADGKKPEPEAPPPVQPVTPDPTAPITGPFTQAIHGASNVTPPPAPAVDPQGPAATQGVGTAVDAPAAPGVGADQGPTGAGAVPAAVPEPVAAPVTQPPTQESTNATQQSRQGETIDPETGEIIQLGAQGAGGDGGQRPEDALQPGADAKGPQPAPDQPAAPAAASTPPEGKPAAPTEPLDLGAHTAATSPHNDRPEPTQAQKEAGNAKLGHIVMNGVGLSIENPEGSTRKSKPGSPVKWETTMKGGHYGYVKGSIGMDGDHVDTFIKPGTPLDFSGTVFVVDQIDPATGKPDEHKVMIGYQNGMAARQAYQGNYQPGWKGLKAITPMTWDEFKRWVKSEGTKAPLADGKHAPDAPAAMPGSAPTSAPNPDTTSSAAAPPEPTPAQTQAAAPSKTESVSPAATGPSPDGTPATTKSNTLRVGTMPTNAEPVTIKDGVIFIGKYEALNFDTGEPVRIAPDANPMQIRKALADNKALGTHQKVFGGVAPTDETTITPDVKTAPVEVQEPVEPAAQPEPATALNPLQKKVKEARQKKAVEAGNKRPTAAQVLDAAATTIPYGKAHTNTEGIRQKGRIITALTNLGLKPGEAQTILDRAMTTEARRRMPNMRFILPMDVRNAADDLGYTRLPDPEPAAKPAEPAAPIEPKAAPASINTLPLAERWDALVAHTKVDGGDPDKGQRSYRAFTQLVGSVGEKPMDVWGRWSSSIGSTEHLNRTGPEVLKWMESNLVGQLDGYNQGLPGNQMGLTTRGDTTYWQRALDEIERRSKDHNNYMDRLEKQARDVEELGGDAKRVAEARATVMAFNKVYSANERRAREGLKEAEVREKDKALADAASEAAKYKPFDTKELSKKPTPGSMSGWFTANYEGKTVWTQGTILDVGGTPPHLIGYQTRMDTLGRNKDGKLDVSRVIPRQKGPQATPFGFYDGEYGKSANGLVYFDAEGRLIGVNATFFRYFASKYKGAEFFASPDGDAITVRHDGKTVGVIMPIRITGAKVGEAAPTVADIKAKIVAPPAAPAQDAPRSPEADHQAAIKDVADRRRKAAEAVRASVVKKTNANSAMVWQIIGPDGEAVSGPPGSYPGRGPLAGTSTMGNRGWKTKGEADAAFAELNRKADEILGKEPAKARTPNKMQQRIAAIERQRADYFTPGNIVQGYGGYDRVISYTPGPTWSVKVVEVRKTADGWVDVDARNVRNHSTQPEPKEFARGPIGSILPKASPVIAPAAKPENVLSIEMGGGSIDLTLDKPAWTATPDEVKGAVQKAGFSHEAKGSYDPMRPWYEAHSEALAAAAKEGKVIPDNVLYERPGLIRTDLNDDQADLASDAMVSEYRDTKDYAKAVQAYRDFGKQPAATNTENAGAELTYNKRNRVRTGIKWSDIADKDVALRVSETTKSNVSPKPDYQAMVDGGMEPIIAHLVKQAYDSLSAGPNTGMRAPTDADLQGYIDGVQRYMAGVMAWAENPAQTRAWILSMGRRAGVMAGAVSGTPTSLSSMAQTPEKSLIEAVYPTGWRTHDAELRLIGGNKALQGLQPSTDHAMKATKDIGKGWPAKQEAWQKQGYSIVSGDKFAMDTYAGKDHTGKPYVTVFVRMVTDSRAVELMQKTFDGATDKYDPQALEWGAQAVESVKGKHLLLGKFNRLKGTFDTLDAAKEKARELTKRDGKTTVSDKGISVEDARREGVQHRMEGEDISSDRLKDTFGLTAVNFGDWMLGNAHVKERQLHLNHAYDSFMDLAGVLGVPPKALSLNGMLGLAIGAQGTGQYAAHFVPGVNEINLTRTSGAGSLAHEFGHGLDHYFARLAGLTRMADPFLTEFATQPAVTNRFVDGKNTKVNTFGDVRPEIVDAFKTIVQAMNKRPTTEAETKLRRQESLNKANKQVAGWLAAIRRDFERLAVTGVIRDNKKEDAPDGLMEKFDALAERIKAMDLGDGAVAVGNNLVLSPPVSDIRDLYKQATGRVYSLDQIKGLQSNIDHAKYLTDSLASTEAHVPQMVTTDYATAAMKLDKDKGGKRYWSTDLEKFARAFDAFVSDKLEAAAAKNTYLSHAGRTGETVPTGTEREAINAGIQKLVDAIQTREDDAGNVAMFARSNRTGGVHMDDAEAIIAQVREALPTAPPIIALESIAQAPADLRKFIREAGAQDDFEAAYHNGKIYVLPSNVGSTTRLQFLLAHHEIRHHGLGAMLGPRKNAVMFAIHATNANVRAAAAEQVRKGYAASKVLATEEALADMPVEDLVKLNGWDKIVAAVREWLRGAAMRLRRVGLANVADAIEPSAWTDKDVAALVARAEGVSRGGSAKYATEGTVFGQDGDMPARIINEVKDAIQRWTGADVSKAAPELIKARALKELRAALTDNKMSTNDMHKLAYNWLAKSYEYAPASGRMIEDAGSSPVVTAMNAMVAKRAAEGGKHGPTALPWGDKFAVVVDGRVVDSESTMAEAVDSAKYIDAEFWRGNFTDIDGNDTGYARWTAQGPALFARGGLDGVTDKINTTTKTVSNAAAHYRGLGLQALGRRQITEIYSGILPQLPTYNTLMAQMDADKNEAGAEADQIAQDWGKLKDERQLAELMHDATLAQMDPEKPLLRGDDPLTYDRLRDQFVALSPEARKVYVDARETYRTHHENVRQAIRDRIERSELRGQRKAELLQQMDDEFYKAIKGVYFPLARFGDYVVIVRDGTGKAVSVNRAETINEAEALQRSLRQAYPDMTVGKVLKSKEFNAGRDAVGRGFMQNLYEVLGKQDMDEMQRAEMEDMLGQLYLSALPDLSWAKHGIHRKGTPGFSQDARRAFAQNTFHGARYLAKVRYSDLLENELSDAQKQVDGMTDSESFDSVKAQQVIDEMVKRHDAAMNPAGNSLSTALTSLGFVFHLGLSPASAMVNLTQTALVAYPIMGAKWGFDKAAAALLKASQQAAANKNDISAALSPDEKRAYDEAVRSGVIDVTMAHDLAGISQGEDAKVSWKLRPVMRWASFLFHHAEKFNRQATFVAAYRLAREAGSNPVQAYDQAVKATYDGHFDYSNTNRPRIMQGNAAKVILLFKQYGQNMVYTLARQAYLSIKGKNQFERAQARKALGGLLAMHAAAAGVLGLPMVSTLLAAASMVGGDDDEPWDAEVALRNMLADALGDQAADVLARGLSRLTPWDISGRVGLDKLILPDIQEGLEGQRLGESAMAAALGPVAGIGVALLKGMQEVSDGNWARGLEAMAPSLLRGPARAVRYASEGAIDKTGKPIVEDVNSFGIAGQALGFSPSDVRLATEAKSAVHQADARLAKRRATLMRHYAMAMIAGDEEGAADAREDILAFNERNPQRRINPLQMARSVATRRKQIAESQGGVYLPKTHRDAMEAGQFGMP